MICSNSFPNFVLSAVILFLFIANTHVASQSFPQFGGSSDSAFAFECLSKGLNFRRDDGSSCVCTALFTANCGQGGQSGNGIITRNTNTIPETDVPRARSVVVLPSNPPAQPPPQQENPYPHPLDPLTPDEILKTRYVLEGSLTPLRFSRLKFSIITLKEPAKAELLPYFLENRSPPNKRITRRSSATLVEDGTGVMYEAVINLDNAVLETFVVAAPGSKPFATGETANTINEIVKADLRVQERCRGLGYPDMNLVVVEGMVMHDLGDGDTYRNLTRPFQVFMYGRKFPTDNYYAHPFDFLVIVDEANRQVLALEDLPTHEKHDFGKDKRGNTVPEKSSNYDNNFRIPGDKPINIVMPEGPSFRVEGNKITWQKFNMRIGFNPREGLILHNVGYKDNEGQYRPILYRASLSEVATYYADPRPPFHRKYAYDEGNIGFGFATTPLVDQVDCLGSTHFFDVTTHNTTGHPITVQKGICIFEDDAGILWKHAPNRYSTEGNLVVRSHRLNIMTSANFGNYDYVLTWSFHQDASISLKTQLTGIVSTNMVAVNATPAGFGVLVSPQVDAQFHQHVFAVRLDVEVDGTKNSVHSTEARPLSEPSGSREHPLGNGFTTVQHHFTTQAEGCSRINPFTGRSWIVTNPGKIHPITGSPVGWKIMPVVDPVIMMKSESPIYSQMGFLHCDIWATRYEEDQLYAGGHYLNNSGLPEWVVNNQGSIQNTDIVLWHVFSPVHIPRVEDYPVMPIEGRELWIKPYNFFNQNPALS